MKQLVTKNAPGFLVCLVIALIAQGVAKFFPSIGAALFAIGLGILCGNTFLNRPVFDSGTKFSERSLLEYSIVLTGATLLLRDILALGWNGLAFIACQMALTIVAAYQTGRHMGFGKKFSLLMGPATRYAVPPPLPPFPRWWRRTARTRAFPSPL